MIKSKYKKVLVVIFCLIIATMSVTTCIMVGNFQHDEACNTINCSMCTLIDISTDFMRNLVYANIIIYILIVNLSLIQLIAKKLQQTQKLTLVQLNVIQNK